MLPDVANLVRVEHLSARPQRLGLNSAVHGAEKQEEEEEEEAGFREQVTRWDLRDLHMKLCVGDGSRSDTGATMDLEIIVDIFFRIRRPRFCQNHSAAASGSTASAPRSASPARDGQSGFSVVDFDCITDSSGPPQLA